MKNLFHIGFFFNLFRYEPLEEHVRGVIFLLNRRIHELVDQRGHKLFMLEDLFEYGVDILPVRGWGINRCQFHPAAAFNDKIIDLHGVKCLFFILDTRPVGETRQAHVFQGGRHGQIQVRRIEFCVDLVVQRLFYNRINHDDCPFQNPCLLQYSRAVTEAADTQNSATGASPGLRY